MSKMPWYERPEEKLPDMRDADEHADVWAALKGLPPDHPARRAYSEGADTITLTHLVRERRDIVEALTEAYLAGYWRSLQRSGRHFRP
jgi:hypothetical protein